MTKKEFTKIEQRFFNAIEKTPAWRTSVSLIIFKENKELCGTEYISGQVRNIENEHFFIFDENSKKRYRVHRKIVKYLRNFMILKKSWETI